jgi:hypothetical protein
MEPLKSCPFCGGEADYLPDRLMAPGAEPPVFCDGCHASALDAAAWNRRASGWQPISTAPRDGTSVLFCCPPYRAYEGCWWVDWDDWRAADGTAIRPTHWHPLPSAPEPTP